MKTSFIILCIIVMLLAFGAVNLYREMPRTGPPLVKLPGGIEGVLCRFS